MRKRKRIVHKIEIDYLTTFLYLDSIESGKIAWATVATDRSQYSMNGYEVLPWQISE